MPYQRAPEGSLARLLTIFAILLVAEAVLGYRAALGGSIFSLLILILFALIGGVLIRVIKNILYNVYVRVHGLQFYSC